MTPPFLPIQIVVTGTIAPTPEDETVEERVYRRLQEALAPLKGEVLTYETRKTIRVVASNILREESFPVDVTITLTSTSKKDFPETLFVGGYDE